MMVLASCAFCALAGAVQIISNSLFCFKSFWSSGIAALDLATKGEAATALGWLPANEEIMIVPVKAEMLYDQALDPTYK